MLLGMLGETYRALLETVHRAMGDATVSASATVHDGRITVTLLDDGDAVAGEEETEPGAFLDRRHRFRVLDRHNALVLERDVRRA